MVDRMAERDASTLDLPEGAGSDAPAPRRGMPDARLKIWLGFLQFLFGTVALGVFTTLINDRIQRRDIELREQTQIVDFLEYAMNSNVGYRLRFADFLRTVTRSDELRERWGDYYSIVKEEFDSVQALADTTQKRLEDAQGADSLSLLSELEALRLETSRYQTTPTEPSPQARIYFHIADEGQRDLAQRLADQVRESGFLMPGIEQRDNSPSANEIRFFRRAEEAEARYIAEILRTQDVSVEVRYIPGYESSGTLRRRQYELWLGTGYTPGT